jgi:hypothetical protein
LRRDLPNVKNRHDPEATALQQSMSPDLVLAALDEGGNLEERLKQSTETQESANSSQKTDDRAPVSGTEGEV